MSSIIYLHGFGSTGNSEKSQLLTATGAKVFAPTLPISPSETIKIISEIVKSVDSYPLLFIGTSLGGFWATYFSQKFDCPCIAVNPSTNPGHRMSQQVGRTITNFSTGLPFVITEQDIAEYHRCEADVAANSNGKMLNLFLAEDDTIIPCIDAVNYYKHFDYRCMTRDGGHQFAKHWDKVIEQAGYIIQNSKCNDI